MKAFITGVSGQDGWYLSKFLMDEGTHVTGMAYSTEVSFEDTHLIPSGVEVVFGDVRDRFSIPQDTDEVYHLAAMHDVHGSFTKPHDALIVNGIGTLNALEAAKRVGARFFNAASYTGPTSPYAIGKMAGAHLVQMYREAYGMHACNGVLYNHESPRRGEHFVTQKICRGVAAIASNRNNTIKLGNTSVSRDWMHAHDAVRGMVAIVRHDTPDDYTLASGVTHTLSQWCDHAFNRVAIADWQRFVVSDTSHFRPIEEAPRGGDATKAREVLGWSPQIAFKDMIEEMVDAAAH